MVYPCPCCGFDVLSEPPGSYEICPICYWEDDIVQLAFPDMAGGANTCSLINGQRHFSEYGVCETRFKDNVRAPKKSELRNATWRPLEPERDRYLKWASSEDREKWQTVKDSSIQCLYYWAAEYWLDQREAEQNDARERPSSSDLNG